MLLISRSSGLRRLTLAICLATAPAAPATAQAPTPFQVAEAQVRVGHLHITGNTAFDMEALHALVREAEGQVLTLPQIEALANRITAFYRQHGFLLARAYIPAQEIRDGGVVEVAILEGRLGAIEVQGNKHYRADSLKKYVLPPEETRAFNAQRFERGLLLLNDLPGLGVKSTLKPGTAVGTTDVVLDVDRDRLIDGSLEANNYGSRLTGRERFTANLNVNNPLGLGDQVSMRALASREFDLLWLTRFGYTVPLATWGTRVGFSHTHIHSEVGQEFRELGIQGAGDIYSVVATHPFARSRAFSLYGTIGLDWKNLRTEILGETVSHDYLRVLNVGGSVEVVDRWRGLNSGSLTVAQGLPDFMYGLKAIDERTSRVGAGGLFTKVGGEYSRLQQIVGPTSAFFRVTSQWASTQVPSPEQFTVGGQGTVRGYPVSEIAGDWGYVTTLELRWNAPGFGHLPAFGGRTWGDLLQAFWFIDSGAIRTLHPPDGTPGSKHLTSTGVGVRFTIPDNLHVKLEYAKPILRPIGGPEPSDKLDHTFYFLVIKWF
ncbi:MAG: ShlB/FhaC/HecB family hemolysin secretion/activation protein [Candidatus Rokubacteria bacterium]|nr:ShlB/FhaC/HecB family hemolysin secretion/activation protein [Candidatus Rokubacteria bacterium]MBI3826843.1 ShlB/FhaC/HecB family hemolysin secretion/activation protein [Candidatus Rokubacteria bacterium]